VSASLGCNAMGGTVDTVGTRLRVSQLFSTRIGCDGALASLESGYRTVLQEVVYFGVRGDTLWLYDAGLRMRARYRAVR
jgi:heat shock protein HslJ